MNDGLVVRSTVRELVARWEETVAQVRTAFGMLVVAEERLNEIFAMGESRHEIRIDASRGTYRDCFDDVDDCLGRMRKQAWSTIIERLELQRMMSNGRWKELRRMLDAGELPEITEDNVLAFARGHAENLGAMLTEAIREVYDWLRPRMCHGRGTGWSYRTNDRVEVGRKVVLPYSVERGYGGGRFHLTYGHEQSFTALENVMSALDGRGQISKTYGGEIGDAIKASADGIGETRYFKFKCFKNRNIHIEFRRLDLLAKFNRVAGGANLRPATEEEHRARER